MRKIYNDHNQWMCPCLKDGNPQYTWVVVNKNVIEENYIFIGYGLTRLVNGEYVKIITSKDDDASAVVIDDYEAYELLKSYDKLDLIYSDRRFQDLNRFQPTERSDVADRDSPKFNLRKNHFIDPE